MGGGGRILASPRVFLLSLWTVLRSNHLLLSNGFHKCQLAVTSRAKYSKKRYLKMKQVNWPLICRCLNTITSTLTEKSSRRLLLGKNIKSSLNWSSIGATQIVHFLPLTSSNSSRPTQTINATGATQETSFWTCNTQRPAPVGFIVREGPEDLLLVRGKNWTDICIITEISPLLFNKRVNHLRLTVTNPSLSVEERADRLHLQHRRPGLVRRGVGPDQEVDGLLREERDRALPRHGHRSRRMAAGGFSIQVAGIKPRTSQPWAHHACH